MKKSKISFKDKYNGLDVDARLEKLEQAIKSKCKDCCAGSKKEALMCPVKDCPLNDFTFLLKD